MNHIFISYSKRDIAFARHLYALLEAEGFLVWMDKKLAPQDRWWYKIEENIISCDAFIVIMSPDAKESAWVEREILVAEDPDHRKPIFPVLLAGKGWGRLAEIQYEDATAGLEYLLSPDFLSALQAIVPTNTGGEAPPQLPHETAQISHETVQLLRETMLEISMAQAQPVVQAQPAIQQQHVPKPRKSLFVPLVATLVVVIAAAFGIASIANNARTPTPAPTTAIAALSATSTATNADMSVSEYETLIAGETRTVIAQSWTPPPPPPITPTPIHTLTNRQAAETRIAANLTGTATQWAETPTATYTLPSPPSATHTATSLPAGYLAQDVKGISMVFVTRGLFMMGSDETRDKDADSDELWQHSVMIEKDFWIDRTEVTNLDYKKFVDANGYAQDQWWTNAGREWKKTHNKPNDYPDFTDDEQPRVGVTWYEAYAYCAWRGGRLPTEAEWEYAARGTDGRIYPWGQIFDANKAVYKDNSDAKSAKVGSKPEGKSWVGALDMSGNVWEWTNTIYDTGKFVYPYATDERENMNSGGKRVPRGGAWNSLSVFLRTAYRFGYGTNLEANVIGFRCVRPT